MTIDPFSTKWVANPLQQHTQHQHIWRCVQPFCRNQQLGCARPFCSWHPFYTTKWGAQPHLVNWKGDCFFHFHLKMRFLPHGACSFSTSELPKVVRSWRVLYIFTWKCASRHSGVQLFDVSSAKSAPDLTCFVHVHLKMCFSPQRRAISAALTSLLFDWPDRRIIEKHKRRL